MTKKYIIICVISLLFLNYSYKTKTKITDNIRTYTTDSVRINTPLYSFKPYSYLEQLEAAALSNDSFINMTSVKEENEFIQMNKTVYQVSLDFFTVNQDYDYKMSDPFYHKALYSPFCKYYNVKGLGAEQVFFGCGTYDLWKTIAGFILPQGIAIGLGPQFPDYVGLLKATGRNYISIHNNKFTFPTKEFIEKINELKESCCCVIIDRPSNPNGLCGSLKEIEEILNAAVKYGIPVIIDEAYGNYISLEESAIQLADHHKNIIWMRSNAKAYGIGGLRVGALVFGSKSLASYFKKVHTPVAPDVFSVEVSKKLFQLGDSVLIPLQNKIKEMKKIIVDSLTSYGYYCLPSHTNVPVLMFKKDMRNLSRDFIENRVIVRNGEYYKGTCEVLDSTYARIRIPLDDKKIKDFLNVAKKNYNKK